MMTTLLERPDLFHKHAWVPLRKGHALKLCECGAIRAPQAKAGKNTINVGIAGPLDVMRWSGSATPTAGGDVGIDIADGRPRNFVMGESRDLAIAYESQGTGLVRLWLIQQNAALTTLFNWGFATAPTTVGTPTVVNVSTGEGQFIQYLSAAALNSDAGVIATAFTQTQRIYAPIYTFAMRTAATITNVRTWAGLFSGSPMASSTPALHYAAFRYATDVDGTAFWRCVTDNGSGAPTVTTTTVAFSGTTSYRLKIVFDQAASKVTFLINNAIVATHVATLPTTTQDLGHVQQVRTLDAAAKGIRFGRIMVAQRAA